MNKFYDVFKGKSREDNACLMFLLRNLFVNFLLFSFDDVSKGLKRRFVPKFNLRQPLCKQELKERKRSCFQFILDLVW